MFRILHDREEYETTFMEQNQILAKILWDYLQMRQPLEKADCILVLGSYDTKVAERGAELFLKGYAPIVMFSGNVGRLTLGMWEKSEAEAFAEIAIKMGVPEEKIIIESKSTNTGENIDFSIKLLAEKGLNPQKFIVVQKPYMERRAFATFKKHFPDKDVIMASPEINFEDYLKLPPAEDFHINVMVGDLQRIKIYPEKGFQIHQEIPGNVWQAYEELVELGYTSHLTK